MFDGIDSVMSGKKNQKIAFTVVWGNEGGHFNTMIALGKRLIASGYDVDFIGVEDQRNYFENQNMNYRGIASKVFPVGSLDLFLKSSPQKQFEMLKEYTDALFLESALFAEYSLIIGDCNDHCDKLIALKNKVPLIIINHPMAINTKKLPPYWSIDQPDKNGQMKLGTRFKMVKKKLFDFLIGFSPSVRGYKKLLADYQMDLEGLFSRFFPDSNKPMSFKDLKNFFSHIPVLIPCPFDLDFPHQPNPNEFYADSLINRANQSESFDWSSISADKKIIFVSMGSFIRLPQQHIQAFFQCMIDSVKKSKKLHMVISLSRAIEPKIFQDVPENITLMEWAPHSEILSRASVVINQGGLNTIKDCIHHGVPMISFPIDRDHPGNAARIAFHGIGFIGDIQNPCPAKTKEMIIELLDNPGYLNRIRKMQKIFIEKESRNEVVEWIDKVIH